MPVQICVDSQALAVAAVGNFLMLARAAITERGQFSVALSGGSTPRLMHARLSDEPFASQIDWLNVHIFWGDERCVPPDDDESNYRMARETLLDHIPIPGDNIHRMRGEIDPYQAAAEYEADLKAFFGEQPRFDLIFLGMGDDGHTASLFPNTAALDETERWVVANHVTQKDTWRITLTAPVINAAANVMFLVSGQKKAERLNQVLNGPYHPHQLPSQLINPTHGKVIWLVDSAAAALL